MHLTTTVEPRTQARLVGLDVLRATAIVLVLGRHIPIPAESARIPWRGFFETWCRGGWVGVDLFFVLSGFLVAGLLFAEYQARGMISPLRFYVRRGWKIYPAFYVMIGFTIAYYTYLGVRLPKAAVLSELLFLQSYLPGLWNHTWSLAVEEHFYFLLPLLLVALSWNKRSAAPLWGILPIAALIGAGCLAARVVHWNSHPAYRDLTNVFPTHFRLDGLFFGAALAYLFRFQTDRFTALAKPWRWALIALGSALLAPAFVLEISSPIVVTVGFTVFYLGAGAVLVGVLMCDVPRRGPFGRSLAAIGRLGSYSYSVYLWHMPFLYWGVPAVQQMLGRPLGFLGAVAAYIVGAFAWGILMAKCVELPALKLRERWFPAPSTVRALTPMTTS